MALNRSPVALE